jgi:hypothetical protein
MINVGKSEKPQQAIRRFVKPGWQSRLPDSRVFIMRKAPGDEGSDCGYKDDAGQEDDRGLYRA